MWNWLAGAAGVVLTGWLLQQIGKGSRRWRSLTVAGHELEVAGRLPDDDALAQQLRAAAEAKVAMYLREPHPERRAAIREGTFAFLGTFYFVVLLLTLNLQWWGYTGLGLVTMLMALSTWAAIRTALKSSQGTV